VFVCVSEVNIILKLTHLPPFPEYTLDLRASPRPSYGDTTRPMAMEGLVVAVTRTTKYTQGARFLCSDEECPCSAGSLMLGGPPGGVHYRADPYAYTGPRDGVIRLVYVIPLINKVWQLSVA